MGLNEIIKIGDRLKCLRIKNGLTQKQLAEIVGIPRTTYANYESNTREPNIDILKKIAKELNVTIGDILSKDFTSENNDERLNSLSFKIFELIPSYSFNEIEKAIELTKERIKNGYMVISNHVMNRDDEIDALIGIFSSCDSLNELANILAIKTTYNLSENLYNKYFSNSNLTHEEIILFLSNSITSDYFIDDEFKAWNCILDALGFEYTYDIVKNNFYYILNYNTFCSLEKKIKNNIWGEFSKIPNEFKLDTNKNNKK